MSAFGKLLRALDRYERAFAVRFVCVDMAGDFIAGVVLSRLLYWHGDDEEGNTRLRIERDGHMWVAKTHLMWWQECRLTTKQVERALKILVKLGLIVTQRYKFNGSPTVHIRIVGDAFVDAWSRAIENPPTDCTYRPRDEESIQKSVSAKKEKTLSPLRRKRPLSPKREKPSSLKGDFQPSLKGITVQGTMGTAVGTARDTSNSSGSLNNNNNGSGVVVGDASHLNGNGMAVDAALLKRMIAQDLPETEAARLVASKPDACRAWLGYVARQKNIINPAGFLLTKLATEDMPPGHQVSPQRTQTPPPTKETREAENARQEAENAQLDAAFAALPEDEQQAIDERVRQRLGVIAQKRKPAVEALVPGRRDEMRALVVEKRDSR